MPIIRLVVVRVLVYSIICLIMAASLVDIRSLSLGSPSHVLAPETFAATGPGWPQLRGPSYDGHSAETGLADTWPAKGPPVLWARRIGGGYSGVIVRDGRAYTQAQGLTGQSVVALDAETGQTIWQYKYAGPFQPGGMFPGPRATPTWCDGRIYFASPDGLAGCLSAIDGKPLWSLNVRTQFGGRGTVFGYACSPVVEDGKVILPVGGSSASVVALDARTGATLWASGDAPASYCSALPITFQGRRQIVAFLQNALVGFDLQTGRLLWQQSYSQGYDEHSAAPLYDEPFLRTMQAFGAGSHLYKLAAVPPAPGTGDAGCRAKLVRHDSQMSNDVASSVLVDGFVYGFDLASIQTERGRPSRGVFRCMDFKTGQIRWSSDRPGQAAIVVADGKLLMFNDRGQVLLVRVNPQSYEELARAEVFPGQTCWTAPALEHGRLYLRSPTQVACLFVGKPERMSSRQRELARPLSTIPRVVRRDLTWLMAGERPYPFELPDLRELTRWYLFSLGALVAAGVLAAVTLITLRIFGGHWRSLPARVVLWIGLLILGLVVTPLANRYAGQFVFTWPLSLITAQQLALAALSRPRQTKMSHTDGWLGTIGAMSLVLACLLYFNVTRQVNLAPAWYFLATLPVTWPLAVPAARSLWRRRGIVADVLWMGAIFSLSFWASGGVMLWRTAHP
jgi:outer membrane protein assembly factor BamB